jgi:hypothetical protein
MDRSASCRWSSEVPNDDCGHRFSQSKFKFVRERRLLAASRAVQCIQRHACAPRHVGKNKGVLFCVILPLEADRHEGKRGMNAPRSRVDNPKKRRMHTSIRQGIARRRDREGSRGMTKAARELSCAAFGMNCRIRPVASP